MGHPWFRLNYPYVESEPSVKFPTLLILAVAASIDAGANRATRRATNRPTRRAIDTSERYTGPAGAAEILGVTTRTIYNALNDGRLKGYKFGATVRIRLSDIESALNTRGGDA